MAINTRFTRQFELEWPIVSAPMALASGGKLAAEVTLGGGLGLIGGGYGDADFNEKAWDDAGNTSTGIGFITWSLAKQPQLLDQAIEHAPAMIMLSFGDPSEPGAKIKNAGIPLVCQCQTTQHISQAMKAGADIIVAQGSEAGGHGAGRGTLNFVAEAADILAKSSPDTLLLAAGGIGDGRGLAACLMLGADGALIGSRYWATRESLAPEGIKNSALSATGDDTLRTSVPDVARNMDWPEGFDIRVLRNRLMDEYHGNLDQLSDQEKQILSERYLTAASKGDPDEAGVIVGEVAGMISDIPGARELTIRIGEQADTILRRSTQYLIS